VARKKADKSGYWPKEAQVKSPIGFNDSIKSLPVLVIAFISIFAASYLFYSHTIGYDLVYCDDNILILDNQKFNSDPDNIQKAFEKTIGTSYYRPLLSISFILDNQSGGIDTSVYRQTNVLLHSIASALIFAFLIIAGFELIPAILFSLFVALHPILTPSASWISARNDSMIAVFILLSFIFLLIYYKSKSWAAIPALIFHILAFQMSLFTKEVAIMLPFIAILIPLYMFKEKLFSTKNIALYSGWFISGLIWFLMRKTAVDKIQSPDEFGISAFIDNAPSVLAFIGKIFLPIKMIALSNYELLSILAGAIFLASIVSLIVIRKIYNWRVLFGALWFLLFLLPTFFVRIMMVDDFFDYAEHRIFLPIIGLLVIVYEIIRSYKVDFRKTVSISVFSVIIVVFAIRSWFYTETFTDRKAFWGHHIEVYPDKARGYLDMGKAYYSEQKYDSAAIVYRNGIDRNPDNNNFYIDITAVYIKLRQYDNAVAYGKKAVANEPQNALANYNLARAYLNLKQYNMALEPMKNAVRIRREPNWILDLGNVYFSLKDFENAIKTYNVVLAQFPNNALVFSNLGAAYASLKRFDDAEKYWKKAIVINPKSFDSYNNLIKLYIMLNRQADALEYKKGLEAAGGLLESGINTVPQTEAKAKSR
jgi:Flp pilus assembly protein TadD